MENIIIKNDEKFKSIYISFNFTFKIKKEEYAKNSIMASVLSKASKKYNSVKEIEDYLNYLYGSLFEVECNKFGDLYNIEFKLNVVNKKFLPNNEDVLIKVLEFLNEIIYNPLLVDNNNNIMFTDKIFLREKQNTIQKINKRKDDKLRYGIAKTEELLFENENYGMYIYGDEESVKKVENIDIYNAYVNMINNSNVTVILTGNLSGYENIIEDIKKIFKDNIRSNVTYEYLRENINNKVEDSYREVVEKIDTKQSVIGLGLKIDNVSKDEIYILNMYSSILGGTPSSKLFQNVREKESLAYTTRTRYYRFKDAIILYAGIEEANFNKAKEVMIEQINDMKKGNITDIEFTSAKQSLISDIKEYVDSKILVSKQNLINLLEDNEDNIETIIRKIESVTIEDVIKISKRINLKLVYLLGGETDE